VDVNCHVLQKQGLPKRRDLLSGDADYQTEISSKNDYLMEAIECRGKPGKWRSSFLNCRDGTELFCHSNLACDVVACLRPVQIKRICLTLRICQGLIKLSG
jgi:hypothetical protein